MCIKDCKVYTPSWKESGKDVYKRLKNGILILAGIDQIVGAPHLPPTLPRRL